MGMPGLGQMDGISVESSQSPWSPSNLIACLTVIISPSRERALPVCIWAGPHLLGGEVNISFFVEYFWISDKSCRTLVCVIEGLLLTSQTRAVR